MKYIAWLLKAAIFFTLFAFALIALCVVLAIVRWLPDDRTGRKLGRGAAMS